jgi:hypothetical protein
VTQFPRTLLVACLLSTACGGGGNSPPPASPTPERPPSSPEPGTPTPPGTVIRGGERLGWDQSGASQAEVQAFTYVLYVDGSPRTLADIRCSAAASSGYPCSGQLPALVNGGHVLELAAVQNGVEGPRSSPFRVTVSLTTSLVASTLATSQARIVCLDAAVDDCYDAVTIATADGDVTDLTVVPDGRLVFIEGGSAVRVIGPDGLVGTALSVDGGGQRLVSLALSSDFLESRFVYLGFVEERRGAAEFTLRRYREIAGVLGQGAALVTGLPVHDPSARVPIAVDAERLYVAVPAADESAARLSAFAFNGHVLRFARDGSVPADQQSPILARGYARPSALVYEPQESRLWLAGSSGPWKEPVAVLPLANSSRSGPLASSFEARAAVPPPAQASSAMLALALRSRGQTQELWLADGDAHHGIVVRGAVQRLQAIETGLGAVSGVAVTPQAALILAVRSSNEARGAEIIRLVARSSAPIQ